MQRYRLTSLAISSLAIMTLGACEQWKPQRIERPAQTVGTELYGILCDRLVAQNFPEDLENRRFNTVCHKDEFGQFAKPTDVAATPQGTPAAERSRLAEARVVAFAKRRDELIRSFDTLFPDSDANFLNGFKTLLSDMTPLYDREIPNFVATATKALDDVLASPAAVAGLTRMTNREGYRPLTSGGGLLGVIATQPVLTNVVDDAFRVYGKGKDSEVALNQFLFALNQRALDAKKDQVLGSNARSLMQILNAVALAEADDQFTAGVSAEVAKRDACGGVALTAIVAPFVDVNADGCADTDSVGRFVDGLGAQIATPSPFLGLGLRDSARRDTFGRPLDSRGDLLYRYVDTRRTSLTGILANTQPLLQPSSPVMFDLGSELESTFGDRTQKTLLQGVRPQSVVVFNADTSPMLDVVRALAPSLKAADVNNFEGLTVLAKALRSNQTDTARLVGAFVNAKNMANEDTFAKYNKKSTFWDEVSDALIEIADAKDPNGNPVPLLDELLEAFARPEVLPLANAKQLLLSNRDIIDYDPANINNTLNTTTNVVNGQFATAVDRTKSAIGANRSAFHRLLQTIHEARNVQTCNKAGAKMPSPLNGLPGFEECKLFKVTDPATFFVQTIATGGDRNDQLALQGKGRFPVDAGFVALIEAGELLTGNNTFEGLFNQVMQSSSGINGLTLYPTPQAVTRMLFFRPGANAAQNKFFSDLSDPAPSAVCPIDNSLIGTELYGRRICASPADTMRERGKATFFALEMNGLYAALRPLARPFVKYGKETLFLDLLSAVYKHYDGLDANCSSDKSDVRYCSKSGLYTYEPLLAKIMAPSSDVIESLHLATKHLEEAGGARKLGPVLRAFLSRELNTELKDRNSRTFSLRNDGTENPYWTPALLLTKAFDDIDTRRGGNPAGLERWQKARSKLVDQLLGVERDNNDPTSSRMKVAALGNSLPLLIDTVVEELQKKKANNEFNSYVNSGLLADARDAIESPLLTAGLDLLSALRKDPAAERNLLTLLSGSLDPTQSAPFSESVVSLTDGLQALNDETALRPVVTALAGAFDPEVGAVKMMFNMLESTNALDTNKYFTLVMRRAVSPLPGQARTALDVFSDTIIDVNRVDPTQATALETTDLGRILSEARAFLADESSGLKQLITIIQKRNTLQ